MITLKYKNNPLMPSNIQLVFKFPPIIPLIYFDNWLFKWNFKQDQNIAFG